MLLTYVALVTEQRRRYLTDPRFHASAVYLYNYILAGASDDDNL